MGLGIKAQKHEEIIMGIIMGHLSRNSLKTCVFHENRLFREMCPIIIPIIISPSF